MISKVFDVSSPFNRRCPLELEIRPENSLTLYLPMNKNESILSSYDSIKFARAGS